MIPTAIIYEHEGKVVDVYTIRGSFSGKLEVRNSGLLIVLKPNEIWNDGRYGSTYIDSTSVVAIREVKPRAKQDYDGDDDCYEKDSPKAYFKRDTEDKQMLGQDISKEDKYMVSKDSK